jgi:hypothetical protein
MNHVELLSLVPLLAAVGATSVGLLSARALGQTRASRGLNGAATIGIAALVCGHLLPECTEVIGPAAVALALLAAVTPRLAARALGRRHHDGAPRGRAALVALLAHAMADGFALGLPVATGGAVFGGLQAAVLFHRIPEGATRWWLLGALPRRRRNLAFGALGLATIGGFALGLVVASNAGSGAIAALQALAAGLLLHVVAHRSERLVRLGHRLARRLGASSSPAAAPDVTLRP